MKDEHEVIITHPKLTLKVECPKCHRKGMLNLMELDAGCSKCRIHYKVPLRFTFRQIYVPLINAKLGECGHVKVYSVDKFKDALKDIRMMYIAMKCWDVSEIGKEEVELMKQHCNDCGYCENCVTCVDCDMSYEPNKDRECPKCGCKKTKVTYTKLVDSKCSECGSSDVSLTKFFNKSKCTQCGSTNVSEKRKIESNFFTIRREDGKDTKQTR